MSQEIELTGVIPASPEKVYRAWLDEAEHTAFTGQKASVDPNVGGEFSTGNGYCQGRNLELEPNCRIVQTWRSTEFPEDSPDSRVELVFEAADEGTRLTLRHTEIPEGQAESLREGWNEFYFEPLTRYFGDDFTDPGTDDEASVDAAANDDEDEDREVSHSRDDVETVVTAPMYAGEAAVTAPPAGRSAKKAPAKSKPAVKAKAKASGAKKAKPAKKAAKAKKPAMKASAKKGAAKKGAAKKKLVAKKVKKKSKR
ncbi:MAG: SRPBCC domain-containing protein [Myxococcaceae bacterium]